MPLPIEAEDPEALSEPEEAPDLDDLPELDLSPDALAEVEEPDLPPAFGVAEDVEAEVDVLLPEVLLPEALLVVEEDPFLEVVEEPLVAVGELELSDVPVPEEVPPEAVPLEAPVGEPVLPCKPEVPCEPEEPRDPGEEPEVELWPTVPDEEEEEALVPIPPDDPVEEELWLSFCCSF
ncbi:hypothetical protein [Rufibacter roseolus]|uniref:hypothetical protein n=1 Tax=Rufibacter roseolus TaxID=2817375 RepID=UPI001B301052|nr:hypothetical protein [Rufibacter roseolus]